MDEATQRVLEAELNEALRKREQLDTVIGYLSGRLGRDVNVVVGPARIIETALPITPRKGAHPAAMVAEGELYGMSGPKAAVIVLERSGRSRPLKTDELFDAIRKGGVSVGSAGTLYRSMFRDSRFRRVGKGLWGLSAWYPAGTGRTSKTDSTGIDSIVEEVVDEMTESRPDLDDEGAA